MELFLDVLGESLVDTAKMLPFLFLAYLLIEYIETRHGERIEALLAGGGRWGAIPGAVLGCVPQCGFSAIASNFYSSRVITLGTLMAVYLATSDEAIPLLVSMPEPPATLPTRELLLLVIPQTSTGPPPSIPPMPPSWPLCLALFSLAPLLAMLLTSPELPRSTLLIRAMKARRIMVMVNLVGLLVVLVKKLSTF